MGLEMEIIEQRGFASFRMDAFILVHFFCSFSHSSTSMFPCSGAPLHTPHATDTIFGDTARNTSHISCILLALGAWDLNVAAVYHLRTGRPHRHTPIRTIRYGFLFCTRWYSSLRVEKRPEVHLREPHPLEMW